MGSTLFVLGLLWANGTLASGGTSPAAASVGVAQSFGAKNATAGQSLKASTATSSAAGDLLVATIRDRSTTNGLAPVSSVTDSARNHWIRAASVAQGTQDDGEIWYAVSAAGITSVTVTVSINAALAFTVLDITGATTAPLDRTATNSGSGTAPSTGTTATTIQAAEIAVADIGWRTRLTPIGQSAGYTTTAVEQSTVTNTAAGEQAAYRVLSATGAQSYAATFPSSSSAWTGAIATFEVGTSSPTPTPTSIATSTPTSTPTPIPSPTAPHVMLIVEENQEYSSVIGSSNAPYINSLANTYRSATNWYAVQHNSPDDYLELFAGSNLGLPKGTPYSATTLADELHSKAFSWKGYMESMPSNCANGSSSNGLYDSIHNPFRYFTNYASWCSSSNLNTEGVLPYPGSSGLAATLNGANPPAFVWITPNDCDNMHGDPSTGSPCKSSAGSQLVKAGDTWMSTNLAPILASTWFKQNGVVIITWDEGSTNATCCGLGSSAGGHIATLVVSANNQGQGAFTGTGDHYGTLAAIEKTYGVGLLLNSANAVHGDLSGAFGQPTGAIGGTVTDSVTNAVVAGATVSNSGGSTITNGTGGYTLSTVAPGTYTVTASATGYTTQPAAGVKVTSAATTTKNFAMVPNPGSINGTVTDMVTGLPVGSATVCTSTGGTCTSNSTTTALNGTYTLSGLTEGSYQITASATGHSSQTLTVNVSPGGTTKQGLVLAPIPGTISGTVKDSATSIAIGGATVCISTGGTCSSSSTTTAGDGRYTLGNVAPGTYTVTASDTGYATQSDATVAVLTGATTTKGFALVPQPGSITGTVTDSVTHAAIAGATVSYPPGTGSTTTTTAGDGTYTLSNVFEGSYSVTTSATNYTPQTTTVTVSPGATTAQTFALVPQPGTITGTLTDSVTSAAISGATVSYTGPGGSSGNTISGSDGTYSLVALPEGSYTVIASDATFYVPSSGLPVTVGPGGTSTQNIPLSPQPATISGTVVDQTATPVSGATVSYSGGSGTAITGTDGTYSLSVTEGTYT